MKFGHWMMYIMNLIGISLFLMIPIFNLWYLNQLMEKNIFKECKEYWDYNIDYYGKVEE